MQFLKNIIAKHFQGFTYFYRHLGYRIFFALSLSIIVGALDGFGLTMFLPLLQLVNEESSVDAAGLGNMSFLVNYLQGMGIDLTLVVILLIMVGFFVLKGIVKYLNGAYRTLIRQFFIRTLRISLINTFNQVKFSYYVSSDVGRIQNTMSGEVERVSRAFQDYFRTAEFFVLLVVYIGFAFVVDFRFALLVTVGGLLTNVLYNFLYKRTKKISSNYTKGSHVFQGQIIQYVGNYKYLKATGVLPLFSKKLEKTIFSIEESMRKIGFINALVEAVREPILIIVVSAVILIQNKMLHAPLGPILISLLFFYRALTALVSMQQSWNRFLEVSGSLDNMRDFAVEVSSNKEQMGNIKIDHVNHGIALKDVHFSYDKKEVLTAIDLTIVKNETIAFVGESGSGKTTLVNIIAALIPPSKGSMYVDNFSVHELSSTSYQQRIGYITQEPVIFNDTIFNNVTLWSAPTPENMLSFTQALKRASIYDFVVNAKEGGETMLGNNGINLSGGQKQRIFIARELYKNIEVLIMDEATSALDGETEKAIQESIDSLKGQYTIIIVAHRLSTIKNADRIVLMKDGKIESVASYSELLNINSNFRKMVEFQEL
jgi:ABC-type multidrug transport system fused ATPase/permease subunit